MFPDSDNAGELRGKLDESQKKYIDGRISDVLKAVEDYNDALFSLSEYSASILLEFALYASCKLYLPSSS